MESNVCLKGCKISGEIELYTHKLSCLKWKVGSTSGGNGNGGNREKEKMKVGCISSREGERGGASVRSRYVDPEVKSKRHGDLFKVGLEIKGVP